MEMSRSLSIEALRLNQRFELNKNNPNWNEQDLQILITATHDMYDLCRNMDDVKGMIFTTNVPRPIFDQDVD